MTNRESWPSAQDVDVILQDSTVAPKTKREVVEAFQDRLNSSADDFANAMADYHTAITQRLGMNAVKGEEQ